MMRGRSTDGESSHTLSRIGIARFGQKQTVAPDG